LKVRVSMPTCGPPGQKRRKGGGKGEGCRSSTFPLWEIQREGGEGGKKKKKKKKKNLLLLPSSRPLALQGLRGGERINQKNNLIILTRYISRILWGYLEKKKEKTLAKEGSFSPITIPTLYPSWPLGGEKKPIHTKKEEGTRPGSR